MLGLIFTLFLVVILAAVVLGFLLPDKVHVERDTIIDAPAETIFGLISDFKEWDHWSPWAKMDPNADYSFSGAGVGQRMEWKSDDRQVGSGSQEIVELKAPSKMITQLNFGEMGGGRATFHIAPAGQASKVTWSLDTNMRDGVPPLRQPMATYMGFFMDKFMDKPYTEGLANLKAEAERRATAS